MELGLWLQRLGWRWGAKTLSHAAPCTSLLAATTNMTLQGPGTRRISSRAMIILLPLALSCDKQIPALPMVVADPAQTWHFIPAWYLLDAFPLPRKQTLGIFAWRAKVCCKHRFACKNICQNVIQCKATGKGGRGNVSSESSCWRLGKEGLPVYRPSWWEQDLPHWFSDYGSCRDSVIINKKLPIDFSVFSQAHCILPFK